jgi:hypothetical protein
MCALSAHRTRVFERDGKKLHGAKPLKFPGQVEQAHRDDEEKLLLPASFLAVARSRRCAADAYTLTNMRDKPRRFRAVKDSADSQRESMWI